MIEQAESVIVEVRFIGQIKRTFFGAHLAHKRAPRHEMRSESTADKFENIIIFAVNRTF